MILSAIFVTNAVCIYTAIWITWRNARRYYRKRASEMVQNQGHLLHNMFPDTDYHPLISDLSTMLRNKL